MAHILIPAAKQQHGQPRLYQISNESGALQFTQKQVGNLTHSMLISDDVMLVDALGEIFLWVGSGANYVERRSAFGFGIQYLRENDKPTKTPIHTFKEGLPINNEIWAQLFGEAALEQGSPASKNTKNTKSNEELGGPLPNSSPSNAASGTERAACNV